MLGSLEVFRDENVAYASCLWSAGVRAELHVWPGGFHVPDMLVPQAALSQLSSKTSLAWIRRTLLRRG